MTQIIVLDQSSGQVLILPVEYNPSDDMEIAVQDAYDKYNESNYAGIRLKASQCSWMEIPADMEIIYA